jgi:fibronectin-binding autotransporter adhesin
LFGWDGSQAKPITVNVGGTATAENGDQNIGLVTLAGGTLASVNPDGFWGSWHFGRASDKNLLVTSNSTASAEHVAFTAGATIEVASGMTLNFTGFIGDGGGDGPTTVIKEGTGTLLLAGANTYTGNTTINAGTLALGAGGSVSSTNITVNGSATFDVSAISYTLPAGHQLTGNGSVAGNVATAGFTSVILPGVGGVGTLTFNTNLDLSSGAAPTFDLSTTAASGNDQIVVGHNLTLSGSDTIHISALNGAADLDQTADYVLFSVAGTTTMATSPTLAWDGTTPGNYLNYSILKVGQNVVLHYSTGTAPSVIAASASPTSVPRNQAVTISATVTPGSGSVASVTVNATSIGGSAAASLIQDASQLPTLVYTNTLIVGASTPVGSPALTVLAADNSSPTPLTGSFILTMDVPAGSLTWDGLAANDNWSSNLNWIGGYAPGYVGDTVTFAGINRLTPNLDTNYGVTGVVFDSTAGSFIIGTANSSALTIGSGGIANNSASTQTMNVPLTMVSNLTFSAASGNLALAKNIASGGKLITVNGVSNTVFGGAVSGNGSLFKQDSGSLTISSNSAWSGFGASSGGFSGPLIAQAGTVTFKNASTNSVSGELVIGGVVTDGGAGNNAKVVVDGATLNVSSWFSVGRGNGVGGVSSDLVLTNNARVTSQNFSAGYNGNNAANMPKGSVTLNNASSLTVSNGNMNFAESAGSDMTMNVNDTATVSVSGAMGVGMNDGGKGVVNVNGGSVSVGSMGIGGGNSSSATAQGTVTVNSGTLSSDGDVKLGADGSSGDLGKLVVNGGTVNIASTVKRLLSLGQSDYANAEIDVNGGNLHVNANTDIRFATGDNTGINTFNLNSGAVTFYSDNATTIGGSGVLDLHQGSGTSVQNTFNLNGGTLTVPGILAANSAGTSTFNFNGGTLAAAASSTNFMQSLTAANVMSAGATINSAGHNITIAQPLLDGGGNGGLTKTGNGTLTLNGVNTYTGGTAVNAGTLAGTGTIAGGLTNSATLSPGDGGIGALTVSGNIKLNAASTNVFDVDGSTPANDQIVAGANVVYGGVLKIVPTGALTTGQTFTLFSGAGAVNPGNFTSVVSAQPSATFSFTNGVLTVVSAGPSGPAVLTNSFSSGTLSLAWPAGQGWRLQMQTNSLTTGLGTNWIYLTDGSVSSTNITVDATKPTVFYRLAYP